MTEGYILRNDRRYVVNTKKEIFLEGTQPSGEWLCLGAIRFNNFGHPVEHCSFANLPTLAGKWHYKNGKQRWHIHDKDHGTIRTWRNPTHLGFFHS